MATKPRYDLLPANHTVCSCWDRIPQFDCDCQGRHSWDSGDLRRSNRLIPMELWIPVHGFPLQSVLQGWYQNREKNGFHQVIRNIEGLMIHEGEFFRWLEKKHRV